jgi:hypothetical protein
LHNLSSTKFADLSVSIIVRELNVGIRFLLDLPHSHIVIVFVFHHFFFEPLFTIFSIPKRCPPFILVGI